MTSKRSLPVCILRTLPLILAALTVIFAFAALAQQTDTGQPSAASRPIGASTPAPALPHPLRPGAPDLQPASAGRPQSESIVSAASAGTNPLFLPVVTYGSGGGDAESMAVADVNGDGKPDLIVANLFGQSNGDGSVGVLLGKGDGTFQPVVAYDSGGQAAESIAIADVNGDGRPDLIVTNQSGSVGVLLNKGDGTFRAVVTYVTGAYGNNSVTVADLNGDGKPDLAVVSSCLGDDCSGDGAVSVLLGNGDGTFQAAQVYDSGGWNTFSIAVADLNGDGLPDLVLGNTCGSVPTRVCTDGTAAVLLGNGDGTFLPAVTYDSGGEWASSVALADVNGDGKPDIVTASSYYVIVGNRTYGGGITGVLLNNGDGTFNAPEAYYSDGISSQVVADVNGDGKPDILVSEYISEGNNFLVVLLGNGDGTFRRVGAPYSSAGGSGDGLTVADINGDGNLDVLLTDNGCSGFCLSTMGVLLSHGDGTFEPVQTFSTGGGVSRVTATDVNGDGKPDAVLLNECGDASCDSTVGVLMNNTVRPYNPTTTALASSANPAAANQAVTYTATITSQYGGAATGTVAFTDMNPNCHLPNTSIPCTTVANVAVAGNQAAYATSYKSNGPHIVTAAYSGDASNRFSTSAPLTEDIATLPVLSTTALATSGSPSLVRQPVTFTATVTWRYGVTPNGGTVTFYDGDGATVLGSRSTVGGLASFTTSSLTATTHIIKATYSGDATFKTSSGSVTQIVNGYATSTTLISSLNPSIYGQNVTWTATVTTSGKTTPTGKVNFNWDSYSIGTAALSASGVATLTRSALGADAYPLFAAYVGDANNGPSTSTVLNQVVTEATSSATLTSSPNPSTAGQSVTFIATIKSPTVAATGPVTFSAGKTVLGTAQLADGKATFAISTLAVGTTTVKASYYGDSNISGSSASVTETVQP